MDPNPDTMSTPVQIEDDQDGLDGAGMESPLDDATYDVVMALASKLEAIDTYRTYAQDGNAGLWEELARDERRHADRLILQLRQQLA